MKNTYKILSSKPEERDQLEDLGVKKRILK
jgi:hypothetical protein